MVPLTFWVDLVGSGQTSNLLDLVEAIGEKEKIEHESCFRLSRKYLVKLIFKSFTFIILEFGFFLNKRLYYGLQLKGSQTRF